MTSPSFGALIGAAGKTPVLHIPSISFANGHQGFQTSPEKYAIMERGFKRLAARSLLMASPMDAMILDRPPDPDYLAILRAAAAGGARHIVPSAPSGQCLSEDALLCPAALVFIREWDGPVELYMPSHADAKLLLAAGKPAPEQAPDVAALLNDKVFFVRTIEDMGLPQIEAFTGGADAVAARLDRDPGGPVIVRSSAGVGGAASWVAAGAGERLALKKRVEKRRGEIFVLQKFIPSVMSPNLQLYAGDDSICLIGASLQIIEGHTRHAGNLFGGSGDAGLDGKLLTQAAIIAREAAALGYRGLLGIDFIVTAGGEAYAVEINARHNTSTHALWFANRLANGDPFIPIKAGRAAYRKWPSSGGRLSAMEWMRRLGAAAFDPAKGEGILPYDCGSDDLEAVVIGGDAERREWLSAQGEKAAAGV